MPDLFLDHVLIGIRDLGQTPQTYGETLGFTLTPEGVHPGRGTQNRLIVFGPEYLELISFRDRSKATYRPYLVDFLDSREGMFVFAMGTPDVDAWYSLLREREIEVNAPVDGSRGSGDGAAYSWRQAEIEPHETPGSRTFLIQHHQTVAQRYTEPPQATSHANGVLGIHHLSLAVHDARSAADRWRQSFQLPTISEGEMAEEGLSRVRLDLKNCYLDLLSPLGPGALSRFLERVGEAPYELALKVSDLATTVAELHGRGVETTEAMAGEDGQSAVVEPKSAHGVPLLFIEVEAEWDRC